MPWEMRTVEKQLEAFVEVACRQKMSKADLRKAADIAPNTMTKLRRDEAVNLAILARICETLDCDFGDIIEYVKDSK